MFKTSWPLLNLLMFLLGNQNRKIQHQRWGPGDFARLSVVEVCQCVEFLFIGLGWIFIWFWCFSSKYLKRILVKGLFQMKARTVAERDFKFMNYLHASARGWLQMKDAQKGWMEQRYCYKVLKGLYIPVKSDKQEKDITWFFYFCT